MTMYDPWRDPANWRGMIYMAPNDPRLWVRKRDPRFGWTLNFAHPGRAALVLLGILGASVAVSFAARALTPGLP